MKKFLKIFGIGLVVVIIVVAIGVGFYIGPIIKIGMEDIGPKITQVPIAVDAVNVSLLTGSVQIKGLRVGNPQGYKTPQAISVGVASVSVDPFSVLSNKIIVHSVQVSSPQITFEGGLTGNNLTKIMDNVNAQTRNGGPASSQNKAANQPAPKIEVDDFLIAGAKAHVSLTGLGGREMTLPLPDIHLTDLGKDTNGLTPAELTRAVLDAVISDTVKAVTESVSQLGQGAKNLGKDAGQTVGGELNKVTSSIGGLFGK